MPSYLLRPNGDTAKVDWTEDPVGPAFSTQNDAVTQPTAPTTGSNRITSATAGHICQLDVGTAVLVPGERVTQVRMWAYATTPVGGTINIVGAISGGGDLGSSFTIPSNSAFGWFSQTYNGTLTQTQVDALQVKAQNVASVATSEIDAMYLEVTTVLRSQVPFAPFIPSIPSIAS